MKKNLSVVVAFLSAALIFSGCGKSESASSYDRSYEAAAAEDSYYEDSDFSSGYADDYDYADADIEYEEAAEYEDNASSGASDDVSTEQIEEYGSKIIRNASLSLDVDNLEQLSVDLKKTVNDYGGYIESMDIHAYDSEYSESRYGYFTVRIPAAKLDAFLNIVKDEGTVTAKSESAEDVTLQYVDVEARISTYEAERDSLMKLLDEATNLKDILTLRDKIADVNYELDSLQRQLKSMQNKVSYSTVSIDAKETRTIASNKGEKSYWSKIGENFAMEMEDGLEMAINLIIFVITRLPLFIILALIVFVIVKVIKLIFGKSGKEKKAAKAAKKQQKADNKPGQAPAGAAVPVPSGQQAPPEQPAPAESQAPEDKPATVQSGGHFTSNVPPIAGSNDTTEKKD